jgi:hypothetical protein
MALSNKYHSSGREYTDAERTQRTKQPRYIWTNRMQKPFNKGIKYANRLAEALGHKFSKAKYYA